MEILTSKNFNENTLIGKVLVKFYADFCNPCKLIQPKYVAWAEEHPEVKCFQVDCEESPELVKKFGVKSIPVFAVFEDGIFQSLNINVIDFDKLVSG